MMNPNELVFVPAYAGLPGMMSKRWDETTPDEQLVALPVNLVYHNQQKLNMGLGKIISVTKGLA